MDKNNQKFQRWLSIVCPAYGTKQLILVSEIWSDVLVILLKIFEAMLSSGCITKAIITRKTRLVLNNSITLEATVRDLEKILKEI